MLVVVASSSETPSLHESSSTTSMSFLCGLPLVLQPVTLSLHHLIWSVHLMFISNLVHPAHSKFKSQHLHLC